MYWSSSSQTPKVAVPPEPSLGTWPPSSGWSFGPSLEPSPNQLYEQLKSQGNTGPDIYHLPFLSPQIFGFVVLLPNPKGFHPARLRDKALSTPTPASIPSPQYLENFITWIHKEQRLLPKSQLPLRLSTFPFTLLPSSLLPDCLSCKGYIHQGEEASLLPLGHL